MRVIYLCIFCSYKLKKKTSNTFHILLLIFIRITHIVKECNQTWSISLYILFSVHLLYHLSHGINGKFPYKYIFLAKYFHFFYSVKLYLNWIYRRKTNKHKHIAPRFTRTFFQNNFSFFFLFSDLKMTRLATGKRILSSNIIFLKVQIKYWGNSIKFVKGVLCWGLDGRGYF